jgi:hypothetical protein
MSIPLLAKKKLSWDRSLGLVSKFFCH